MTLDITMELLRKCADNLEQRFLCPVYLVGSFAEKYTEASDIDLVMVADEGRMLRLTGDTKYNDKRFRFNRKQKLFCEEFIYDFDIDFKIQTEEEAKGRGKFLRLGKYAEPSQIEWEKK